MSKTTQDWLRQLRRCSEKETLETVAERISRKLTGDDLGRFLMAADHRRAELIMNRLYDKIPVSVWKFVR
ncbi:hemolysin expression modulating family protein (plasmid) [Yersinia pestis]|jgi:hemolysin expression modulating protein|uniref:Conserved domain protein n=1 Tax=Yersinia pestis Java 9 TaxID=880632 RepID=E8PSE8_YERPE|nr:MULTISPECIES: Hha/YmoA family nucleoid-associated regulatory protein [Enterobacterales]EDQ2484934.1 hemolysin activation protein [Salmonella enterica subsp. enterica serovar Oranienburg]EDX0932726.1 hemolysin activation protein [Salmonella enterica subsp. enterica]EIT9024832.1 hemolysin activation protein [Escherichia coli]ADW66948.1 conserved domain protein [Yersinia pestis Java 9]AJJ38014.1 hemolysin expression modulating family protein [Yersinia pestis]